MNPEGGATAGLCEPQSFSIPKALKAAPGTLEIDELLVGPEWFAAQVEEQCIAQSLAA
jgi:hypothetical protein